MPENEAMLAAHVQFELARWSGDELAGTIAGEVTAVFSWLDSVRLDQVFNSAQAQELVAEIVHRARITDELTDDVTEIARSVYEAALHDETSVRDLISKQDYDQLAEAVIGMQDARAAVTNQITSSEVYSRLIAHVLYQGIKSYLVSDGGVARRVPGASSLMRLGKGALSSAAPNFEKSVDRQLTAFVNANIAESIRESQTYLNSVLDAELLGSVAEEIWDKNADATIADATGLFTEGALDELILALRDAWFHLRTTSSFELISGRVVDDFFDRHGERSIAAIFADSGITPEELTDRISRYATPIVDQAARDGFLEQRIRHHLSAFYDSYEPVEN